MAKASVFIIEGRDETVRRLTNSLGAVIAQNDFVVIGGVSGVAKEALADAAVGAFDVSQGLVVQASGFVTGEDTFATANQRVYFKASTGEFSDTKTIGYNDVGQLKLVKAGGVIEFLKDYNAPSVSTFAALADVDVAGVTDNDTLKYVASTGKWTDVAV